MTDAVVIKTKNELCISYWEIIGFVSAIVRSIRLVRIEKSASAPEILFDTL